MTSNRNYCFKEIVVASFKALLLQSWTFLQWCFRHVWRCGYIPCVKQCEIWRKLWGMVWYLDIHVCIIYMYVSTDSNINYTNCKSTWFCINTILRSVEDTKGICRSRGKEHNSQTKTDKTTRGKQCRESNIIKEVSCDLTVVWFIFRNCYTLCPLCKKKKKLEKRREIELHSSKVKRKTEI